MNSNGQGYYWETADKVILNDNGQDHVQLRTSFTLNNNGQGLYWKTADKVMLMKICKVVLNNCGQVLYLTIVNNDHIELKRKRIIVNQRRRIVLNDSRQGLYSTTADKDHIEQARTRLQGIITDKDSAEQQRTKTGL